MFKEGDAVKIKPNTTLENGTVVQDWAGIVEEVFPEDKCCLVLLDALSIDAMEEEHLMQVLLKGGLPFLEVIDFENLELSTRRDTEEQLKKALEDLTDRAMDIEHELEEIRMAQQEKLVDAFEESRFYEQLTPAQQKDTGFMEEFMDTIYEYEGLKPSQWTPEAIQTVCLKEIPATWIAEAEVFENLGAILIAFLQFLGEEQHLQQQEDLIAAVQAINTQIPLVAQDKKNWQEPKPLFMEALKAGVDLEDPRAMDAFFMKRNKKKKK